MITLMTVLYAQIMIALEHVGLGIETLYVLTAAALAPIGHDLTNQCFSGSS